jgi:hypothetical protein
MSEFKTGPQHANRYKEYRFMALIGTAYITYQSVHDALTQNSWVWLSWVMAVVFGLTLVELLLMALYDREERLKSAEEEV